MNKNLKHNDSSLVGKTVWSIANWKVNGITEKTILEEKEHIPGQILARADENWDDVIMIGYNAFLTKDEAIAEAKLAQRVAEHELEERLKQVRSWSF